MQSVGQTLRQARLGQRRTLEQISASTRIALKNLEAIEADELNKLSSPFFYRSFVRQFAQDLKLPYDQIQSEVVAAADTMPQPRVPGEGDAALPRRRMRRRFSSRPSFRWLYSFASLWVMLIACSTVYAMWQNSRSELQAQIGTFFKSITATASRKTTGSGKLTNAHATAPASVVQKPQLSAKAAPENANSPAVSSKSDNDVAPSVLYRVELSALEPTWLSLSADGQETFSGILQANETKLLEGKETARVRTGNAGGINVVFNGKAIGALGPRGQVRTVLFSRNGYEVVDSAAHIALAQFIPIGE